jgi:hypothetical protein
LNSWWKKAIGTAVAAVILFFIVRNLVSGLREIETLEFEVSALRIAGSFAILGLLFLTYGGIWRFILDKLGHRIGFGQSMSIWFLSQAGRYIPGKVWFALGRIYLCERAGIPRSVAAVATGLEIMLVLGSAIMVFGMVSALSPDLAGAGYTWGLWLVPVIVVCVHPRIIRGVLSRFRRQTEGFSLAYADTLKLLALYVVCWLIYGAGFYLIATSIRLVGSSPVFAYGRFHLLPEMVGINALSWAGGLLSVITPAGLGVREGISGILLAEIVQKPYPSLIPLVARLWVTIAEVATIGIVLVVRGWK